MNHILGKISLILFSLVLGILPSVSHANDSSACVGLGGLMFENNAHIVMMSEDLLLSPSLVRVEYSYLNESETDQDVLIAFALPNLDKMWATAYSDIAGFKRDFKTWIDGKAVNLISSQDFWNFPDNAGCFRSRQESANEYDLVLRRQIFPSKKLIKVIHQYSPALGGGIPYYSINDIENSLLDVRNQGSESEHSSWFGCTDIDDALKVVSKWIDYKKFNGKYSDEDTETFTWSDLIEYKTLGYILKTGQNWKGPIKRFRLKVTSANGPFFLDTCFKGLRRVSDNVYLFEAENYVPDQNIHLEFHWFGLMGETKWTPSDQNELLETSIALASVYNLENLEATKNLNSLKKEQLRFLRNSIYARHGYKFSSADLTKFFAQFPWYSPKTKNVNLSEVEQQNIQWIQYLEKLK